THASSFILGDLTRRIRRVTERKRTIRRATRRARAGVAGRTRGTEPGRTDRRQPGDRGHACGDRNGRRSGGFDAHIGSALPFAGSRSPDHGPGESVHRTDRSRSSVRGIGAGAKALNDAQFRPSRARGTPGRGEHRHRDQPRRPTRESDRAGHADHPESQRVDARTAPTRNGGYRGQQQQRGGLVTRGRLGEAHLRHLHVGRGMTTTERSHEVKRPTLVRPALRVQAPDGVEWQVEHRISPWRRRIQPIAFVWFMPRRYSEVTPKRPAPRPPSDEDEKTQEIRRPRKNRLEKLPAWLAYITI